MSTRALPGVAGKLILRGGTEARLCRRPAAARGTLAYQVYFNRLVLRSCCGCPAAGHSRAPIPLRSGAVVPQMSPSSVAVAERIQGTKIVCGTTIIPIRPFHAAVSVQTTAATNRFIMMLEYAAGKISNLIEAARRHGSAVRPAGQTG